MRSRRKGSLNLPLKILGKMSVLWAYLILALYFLLIIKVNADANKAGQPCPCAKDLACLDGVCVDGS
uniref:Late nodulin n=1 Tax=Panagrellus redivivus TaxID=6233 RepID=A0A7E4VD03_PANRE